MKKILLAIILLSINLFGNNLCNLSLSNDMIDFGSVYTNETKTAEITLSNFSQKYSAINIEEIKIFSQFNVFKTLNFQPFTIKSGDSKNITFEYANNQNITSEGTAFIRVKCGNNNFSIAVNLKGKSIYKDEIYSFTQDLWEDELRNSLIQFVKKHKSMTYTQARILMWSSLDRFNENVECVYTGKKTYVSDEPNFAELDQYGWNTEHTWPQTYGASNDPERSDLFHIFITDKNANGKRDNFPFGFVKSGISWQEGGSKLGLDDKGTKIFEPRDVHKGNVARALFYFAIKYGNKSNFLTAQELALRDFMQIDPPDDRERAKNDSIFKYQENRNPFIDHPELSLRIPSIATGGSFPKKSDLSKVDEKISIELKQDLDTVSIPVYFYNLGNANLSNATINYSTNGSDFKISGDLNNFTNVKNIQPIYLTVIGKASQTTKGIIEVTDSDNKKHTVEVSTGNYSSIKDENQSNISVSIYPNPIREFAIINIAGLSNLNNDATIKIYNLLGEEILDLTNEIHHSHQIRFNKELLNSNANIYIVKLISGNKVYSNKIIIY